MVTPENDGVQQQQQQQQQQDEEESPKAATDVGKLQGSKSGSGTYMCIHACMLLNFGVCFNIQRMLPHSVYTDTQEVLES